MPLHSDSDIVQGQAVSSLLGPRIEFPDAPPLPPRQKAQAFRTLWVVGVIRLELPLGHSGMMDGLGLTVLLGDSVTAGSFMVPTAPGLPGLFSCMQAQGAVNGPLVHSSCHALTGRPAGPKEGGLCACPRRGSRGGYHVLPPHHLEPTELTYCLGCWPSGSSASLLKGGVSV